MDQFYNYYQYFKDYIYCLFYYKDVFSLEEINIINTNNELKLKYEQLDLDEIYKTLELLNKKLNRNTEIHMILNFINNQLAIKKVEFELKPETINSKNIVKNTLLKYLKDKFEKILFIKKGVCYKIN